MIEIQTTDVRTWDDEALDEALAASGTLHVRTALRIEIARRAEIRINRGMDAQYGPNPFGFTIDDVQAKHDASWYESRQTEAQWLSEIGADCSCCGVEKADCLCGPNEVCCRN